MLLGLSFIVAALLSAGHGAAAPTSGAQAVRVTERDFRVTVSPSRVRAGTIDVKVTNRGPDAHELIVVRSDGGLPFRTDGITIDEEGLTKRIVDAVEPADAGDLNVLHVHLTRGRYILLCNMYGHYMGGMHAVLIVR